MYHKLFQREISHFPDTGHCLLMKAASDLLKSRLKGPKSVKMTNFNVSFGGDCQDRAIRESYYRKGNKPLDFRETLE